MYPHGFQTQVEVRELSQGLCGASRPGHFTGVATVVLKLLHIVQPHVAVFGEKDYQQLQVIRRMARDLDLKVAIASAPIVREPDGLALSSRNAYLSPEDRRRALSLSRGLSAAKARHTAGERQAAAIVAAAREILDATAGVQVEYLELRDAETLAPVAGSLDRPAVLLVAARVGPTRLIDNLALHD
jgi:pantoate--beta-alanine ligase